MWVRMIRQKYLRIGPAPQMNKCPTPAVIQRPLGIALEPDTHIINC